MRAATVLAIMALIMAASVSATGCNCGNALTANYENTLVPDAAQSATTSIELDTNTWQVRFIVSGVLSVTNGHVIAANVNSRQNVATALDNLTQAYTTPDVWNPPACGLGPIDLPANWLGIATSYDNNTCTRSYTIEYSLISPLDQNHHHCHLTQGGQDVFVECELQLNTIRAYDATEPTAFLNKETVFRTNITMPRDLPNTMSTLLHATVAKCSVYAAPDYYVDCRIPGLWSFDSVFTVEANPANWIIASTCAQSQTAIATHIACDLSSISEVYTEVDAVIGAVVAGSGGDKMHFAVNYSLPRLEEASASASLASFVKNIGTRNGKFYYGNDDLLTLEIEVVDTTRLQITGISLFNSDVPAQSYDLRAHAEFETVETNNATYFVIQCYPSRILHDSAFYRDGPHGVNVSFLFTAARRQEGQGEGVVTYHGFGMKVPKESKTSSAPTAVVGIVAATALCAIVVVAVLAVAATRRNKAVKATAPVDPEANPNAAVEIKDAV